MSALSTLLLVSLSGGTAITVPIELQDNYALLVATVNGTDVKLLFDLGNRVPLVLQQDVLDRIKAVPTGESSKFQTIDGVFEAPHFKVSRLEIGGISFADVATTLDAPRSDYKPVAGTDGYLGSGLLKSYEVVLDYSKRTMTLVPRVSGSAVGTCKGTVVPFDQSPKWQGEPVTKADTDVGTVILWWDTGAPASVLRKSLTRDATTKRLALGDADFGPWKFELWDMALPGFDGFLGYDFFAKHVVCIDFPGKRVVIRR